MKLPRLSLARILPHLAVILFAGSMAAQCKNKKSGGGDGGGGGESGAGSTGCPYDSCELDDGDVLGCELDNECGQGFFCLEPSGSGDTVTGNKSGICAKKPTDPGDAGADVSDASSDVNSDIEVPDAGPDAELDASLDGMVDADLDASVDLDATVDADFDATVDADLDADLDAGPGGLEVAAGIFLSSDTADLSESGSSMSFEHTQGVTECPQTIGSITMTNTTSDTPRFIVFTPSGVASTAYSGALVDEITMDISFVCELPWNDGVLTIEFESVDDGGTGTTIGSIDIDILGNVITS